MSDLSFALGPIGWSSGNRLHRACVYGSIHASAVPGELSYRMFRSAVDGSVGLYLKGYEHNIKHCPLWGQTHYVSVDANGLTDYEVWLAGLDALVEISDAVTDQFQNPKVWHTIGAWRVGFVGCAGLDGYVPGWGHRARFMKASQRPNYVAERITGERVRLQVRFDPSVWRNVADARWLNGCETSSRKVPKGVSEWVVSRCM